MSRSHQNSGLVIGNMISGIDQSARALFPFTRHTNDIVYGTEPLTSPGITPTGNGILIEDATTNLATSMTFAGHGSSWVKQSYTYMNLDVYKNTVTTPSVYNNFGFHATNLTVNLDQSGPGYITTSFYANVIASPGFLFGYVRIHYTDGTEANHNWVVTPSGWYSVAGWQRVSCTATMDPLKTPQYIVSIYMYKDNAIAGEVDVAGIQVEQKQYATSYTATSRALSNVTLPTNLISLTEGSIRLNATFFPGFFYKNYSTADGYSRLIGHSTAVNENEIQLNRDGSSGTPRLLFSISNSAGTPAGSWYDVATGALLTNTPYDIVATWSVTSGVIALYINGAMVDSLTGIAATSFPSSFGTLAVGYHPQYAGRQSNCSIRDLCFYSRALSSNEIAMLYSSALNFNSGEGVCT